jgi:large repetitive protein
VLINNSDGTEVNYAPATFGAATNFPVGPVGAKSTGITSANFDGTGPPDLAVANNGTDNVSVLKATTNSAPTANDDPYSVDQDGSLTVSADEGVLTNDTDLNGDTLTATMVSGPTNGMLTTLAADGSFTYTPNTGFSGSDSFTYKANDGKLDSNTATVTITVSDATLPDLSISHTPDGTNGWNKTSPVTLTVSASDTGSGLAAAPTCTDGSTALPLTTGSTAGNWTASVSGDGTHDVSCSVSDNINNSTTASDTVKIDTIAPSISDLGPTTQPNAAGWYKTDVTNTFQATDSSGSGLNGACKTAFPANQAGNNIQSKTTSGEGSSLKVTSATCTDVAGNKALGIDSATFKVDKTAPRVSAATPTGTSIGRGTNVAATFSEKMSPASITNSTFKLYKVTSSGTTQVTNLTLSKSTDGLRATINPYGTSSTLLAANTRYKVVVTTGTRDLAGNALDQDPMKAGNQQKTWTFTTKS